ncbi:PXA domain-containing protein [Entophlyctis helioformis]|nr:PXA domain-containing protein [Entophlyctis helioformis]
MSLRLARQLYESVRDHPRVYLLSPLVYNAAYHLAILFAGAVVFAFWTAISDVLHHRRDISRIRTGAAHFFQHDADARQIAASGGLPIREYPLASTAGWAKIAANRLRESGPFKPRRYDLLNELVGLICRDFVRSWYTPAISDEPAFVSRVEQALHFAFAELKTRIDRIDTVQLLVSRIVPALTTHVREVRKAEYMLSGERVQRRNADGSDETDHLLARFYMNGSLHPAVSCTAAPNPELERSYFRSRVKTILPYIFPKNEVGSRILSTLLREVLVCRILQPIVDTFSDPDYWNQTFDTLAETLKQQEPSSASQSGRGGGDNPLDLDDLDFAGGGGGGAPKPLNADEFIKQIKSCDDVQEAYAIRNAIETEIQIKRSEIFGYEGDDIVNGVKVAKIRSYIDRLQGAYKRIEKRIVGLNTAAARKKAAMGAVGGAGAGVGSGAAGVSSVRGSADTEDTTSDRMSLSTILDNQLMLSYFTDYMETTDRLPLVLFWAQCSTLLAQFGLADVLSLQDLDESIELHSSFADSVWDIPSLAQEIQSIIKIFVARDAPSRLADLSAATVKGLLVLSDLLDNCSMDAVREALVVRGDLQLLVRALSEVYHVMDRDDFPVFARSPMYARMMDHVAAVDAGLSPPLQSMTEFGASQSATPARMSLVRQPAHEDGAGAGERVSNDSERSWNDNGPAAGHGGDDEIAAMDDSQRKNKGLSLIGSMFKGKWRSPEKRGTMGDDDVSQPAPLPVRVDGTPNIEGELHSIVNSEENSFVALLRKKASKRFHGDDRTNSRDELAKDVYRDDKSGGVQQSMTPGASGSVADLSAMGSMSTSTNNLAQGGDGVAPLGDSNKGVFIFPSFKRRSRHSEKPVSPTPPTLPLAAAVPDVVPAERPRSDSFGAVMRRDFGARRARSSSLGDTDRLPQLIVTQTPSSTSLASHSVANSSSSSSFNTGSGFVVKSARSGSVSGANPAGMLGVSGASSQGHTPASSPLPFYTAALPPRATQSQGGSGSASGSAPSSIDTGGFLSQVDQVVGAANNANASNSNASNPVTIGSATAASRTPQLGAGPAESLSPEHNQLRSRRSVSPLLNMMLPGEQSSSQPLADDLSDTNLSSSLADIADSDQEGLSKAQGDDDDAAMQLDGVEMLSFAGVPRTRDQILARYRSDQDILPPIIMVPRRVLQLNDEIARLRTEMEESVRQKEALEASLPRGLQDGGTGGGPASETSVATQKQIQALHYMRVGMEQERRRLLEEKRALELDELDKMIMPDRTVISIGESQIAHEDGKEYAVYPVQVQRINMDGAVSGWIVMRRYSEFLSMHHALRAKFPQLVKESDMPGKMLNSIIKLKNKTLEMRRASLEKYLQSLLRQMDVCRSVEFRKFVCHPEISRLMFSSDGNEQTAKRSFFRNIFQTVDEGIDTFRQKLRPSGQQQQQQQQQPTISPMDAQQQMHMMMMQATPMPANGMYPIYGSVPGYSPMSGAPSSGSPPSNPLTPYGMQQTSPGFLTTLPGNLDPQQQAQLLQLQQHQIQMQMALPSGGGSAGGPGSEYGIPAGSVGQQASATDAMIDLFIELFELKERNNWLRRQAVVLFLQQLFGGTVERRVTESLRWAVGEENVAMTLSTIRTTMWPKDVFDPQFPVRSVEAKRRTRADAQEKLATLLPDMVGSMVGRQNARRGAVRWCALFQNRRLNQHLVHVVVDELLAALFPEVVQLQTLP